MRPQRRKESCQAASDYQRVIADAPLQKMDAQSQPIRPALPSHPQSRGCNERPGPLRMPQLKHVARQDRLNRTRMEARSPIPLHGDGVPRVPHGCL